MARATWDKRSMAVQKDLMVFIDHRYIATIVLSVSLYPKSNQARGQDCGKETYEHCGPKEKWRHNTVHTERTNSPTLFPPLTQQLCIFTVGSRPELCLCPIRSPLILPWKHRSREGTKPMSPSHTVGCLIQETPTLLLLPWLLRHTAEA